MLVLVGLDSLWRGVSPTRCGVVTDQPRSRVTARDTLVCRSLRNVRFCLFPSRDDSLDATLRNADGQAHAATRIEPICASRHASDSTTTRGGACTAQALTADFP